MYLPAYVPKRDPGFVAYRGAPWRALRDEVQDWYPGKSRGLVRRIEWVVAAGLLLVKSSHVTSKEVEDEDKAVSFGEDGVDL